MTHDLRRRTVVSNEPAIAQVRAEDGKRIASIVESADACFRFVEEREVQERASEEVPHYAFWSETLRSGLYATLQEAIDGARIELPWTGDGDWEM